jgi:urease accessory protein
MCAVVVTILPPKSDPAGPIEVLELTWEQRSKPRRMHTTDRGTEIALALPRGTILNDGDTILNTTDRSVIVRSRLESVLVIRPRDIPQACRIGHHLGNWHRAVQIAEADAIITEPDAPLKAWLEDNGITYSTEERPYQPNLRTSPHS